MHMFTVYIVICTLHDPHAFHTMSLKERPLSGCDVRTSIGTEGVQRDEMQLIRKQDLCQLLV